jgi:hypothetical protein
VVNGTASVTVSGEFFSIFAGSALLETEVRIQTAATFFSIFQRAGIVSTDAAVESSGEIQPPTGAHERSVLIAVSGEIQSSGFTTLERFSQLEGAGVVAAAAEFFSIAQSASDFNINGEIQSAGQCEILRGSALDAASSISVSGGLFFSILQSSGLITGLVTVESGGLVSTGEHEGSVSLNAASAILASGIAVSVVHFAPRQSVVIGSTSRSLSVGTEARTQTTELETQTGTI